MDTPTNGGYHRAAPPGNLGIETGQRPTIHRLQQCRGPRGPRTSATAGTGKDARRTQRPDTRAAVCGCPHGWDAGQRTRRDRDAVTHGEAPYLAGKKETRLGAGWIAGWNPEPATQGRPTNQHHQAPRRAFVRARRGGAPPRGGCPTCLSHILSDHRWTPPCRPSVRRSRVDSQGHGFV